MSCPFCRARSCSETSFHIFIVMASRRLEADRFFTSDFTPEVRKIPGPPSSKGGSCTQAIRELRNPAGWLVIAKRTQNVYPAFCYSSFNPSTTSNSNVAVSLYTCVDAVIRPRVRKKSWCNEKYLQINEYAANVCDSILTVWAKSSFETISPAEL